MSGRRLAFVLTAMLLARAAAASELPAVYDEAMRELRTARDPVARAVAAISLGHGFQGVPLPSDPRLDGALREAMALDPDATVQALAAYALCVRGDRRGVSRLVSALRERLASEADPQGYVSDAVRLPVPYLFRALGHCGGAEAVAFLTETSRRAPPRARVVAIPALALVRDDPAVDRVLAALAEDDDPTIRGVARFVIDERNRRRGR